MASIFLHLVCSLMILGFIQTQEPSSPTYPDGSIRLVGGRNPTEGNVEVFYKGRWGSICDDEWDIREAYIVCKMLGYNRAVRATFNSQFGRGRGEWFFRYFFLIAYYLCIMTLVKKYTQKNFILKFGLC